MPKARFPIFRTSLIAIAFATAAPVVHADNSSTSNVPVARPTSASEIDDEGKMVQVNMNGKKMPVRVLDNDPYTHMKSNLSDDGKYHPDEYSFAASSSMADKAYALPTNSLSQSDPEFTDPSRNTFATKAYGDNASPTTTLNSDSKSRFSTYAAYSRSADGFNKNFATSSSDLPSNHAVDVASSTTTAGDQNRAALIAGQQKDLDLVDDSMAHTTYLGPGAQKVPDNLAIKENIVLSRMSGLPNRDLSIDEVRNLINHETKPDTDVKPEESSKPLNDPNYKPEPLRDDPSPGPSPAAGPDDDKNDPVPSPGTMAAPPAPENSEPLPQP